MISDRKYHRLSLLIFIVFIGIGLIIIVLYPTIMSFLPIGIGWGGGFLSIFWGFFSESIKWKKIRGILSQSSLPL